jgi:hypothetical protein
MLGTWWWERNFAVVSVSIDCTGGRRQSTDTPGKVQKLNPAGAVMPVG